MRKIDTHHFHRATRDTSREVNRRIVLNLIREQGPISRADLARAMGVARAMVTSLVNELLKEGVIFEGDTGTAPRGRKPTLLWLRSHDRLAIGIDVLASRTEVQLIDFGGDQLERASIPTVEDPEVLGDALAMQVASFLRDNGRVGTCEGIGIVIPGMVDVRTGKVLNAPTLGWRDLDFREILASRVEVPVHIERDAVACAMARMWLGSHATEESRDFVYLIVSEGVGTGLVVNGEPVRGRHYTAGEFGHVPLVPDGPLCSCGGRGCLEAFTSDVATIARYLGIEFEGRETNRTVRESGISLPHLIERAKAGDNEAREAIEATGRYLGIGLVGIINALNPARIIVGGEITRAWDLLEPLLMAAVRQRALTVSAAATEIGVDQNHAETRLAGASALVIAPVFAAPEIA